jgi:uncharacterized oxidoreductase
MLRFDPKRLQEFGARLLGVGGMSEDDAKLVAQLLVRADLRGYPGHGLSRIPSYVSWVKNGTMNVRDRPTVVHEGKTVAVIDCRHYIGQIAARDGMELAIQKARAHGTGTVVLRRAGHIGRLADFMELAAEAGMIAMGAISVGSGNTAPYGSMEPVAGTNPMAFGVPGAKGRHIILDFATSAMSMGELHKKLIRNEPIPPGILLDGHGKPTTDFDSFRGSPRGVFLSFGGYKGSGLSLITEVLGGILSGNGLGKEWWNREAHGVNGVFLQALAVDEFLPLNQFVTQVDELYDFVKSRKTAPGFSEIFLPGERGRKKEERGLKEGVEIDEVTWTQLATLARAYGLIGDPDLP